MWFLETVTKYIPKKMLVYTANLESAKMKTSRSQTLIYAGISFIADVHKLLSKIQKFTS